MSEKELDLLVSNICNSNKNVILTGVCGSGKTPFLEGYFPSKIEGKGKYLFIDGLSGVEGGWKYDYYPYNLEEKVRQQCSFNDLGKGIYPLLSEINDNSDNLYFCIDEGAFVFTDNVWGEPDEKDASFFMDFSEKVSSLKNLRFVVVFHKKSLDLFGRCIPGTLSNYNVYDIGKLYPKYLKNHFLSFN